MTVPHVPARGPAHPARRRWPAWARRRPMEACAIALIGAGVVMLLQPFALVLYTWSFATTLAGVVLFTIVSKFPE